MSELTACAVELLELERAFQAGEMTEGQSERWRELVARIFGSDNAEQTRRSFRLHAKVPAQVRIRRGTFPCTIHEVSRLGLLVSGEVFSYITHEDVLEIVSVTIDGQVRPVQLKCTIARLDSGRSATSVGVTIASDNSFEDRERYFEQLYYPLYIKHLEYLAGA